jgi:methyltransferase family protein
MQNGGVSGPAFHDHFSRVAGAYATFRPSYPRALFELVAGLAPTRARAWDCGTGSGQAALGLAERFDLVVATDASAAQLARATRHPRVRYVGSTAEACPLAERSIDLVVVAQAVHWFDRGAFFAEARRVLVDRGAIAVWCYGLAGITPEIDSIVERLYAGTLGEYWPWERALVDGHYAAIELPFDEIETPELAIERSMTLGEFTGYVGTWSAAERYRDATGVDPLPAFVEELAVSWGDRSTRRVVRWPLAIRAGRKRGH